MNTHNVGKSLKYETCPECKKRGIPRLETGQRMFKCKYCGYKKILTPGQDW